MGPLHEGGAQGPSTTSRLIQSAYSSSYGARVAKYATALRTQHFVTLATALLNGPDPPNPNSKLAYLTSMRTAARLLLLPTDLPSHLQLLIRKLKTAAAEAPVKQATPIDATKLKRLLKITDRHSAITIQSIVLAALRVNDIFRVAPQDVTVQRTAIRLRIRGAKRQGPGARAYWRFIPRSLLPHHGHWWKRHVPSTTTSKSRIRTQLAKVGLTLHSLRRGMAQMLADAGVPIKRIRDHLGHESEKATRRYVLPGETHIEIRQRMADLIKVFCGPHSGQF